MGLLIREHIAETKILRKQGFEILEKHSNEIWGHNGYIGIKTKLDRIEQVEVNRKRVLGAFGGTIGGLVIERLYSLFIKH